MIRYFENPRTKVVSTWLWFIPGAILTALFTIYIIHGGNFTAFKEKDHLRFLIEFVSVGSIPLIIVLLAKEPKETYGIKRSGLEISLLLSFVFLIGQLCINYVYNTVIYNNNVFINFGTPRYSLNFPENIIYSLLGVFSYGPLEVFFVIFLVVNTEKWLNDNSEKMVTKGLIITAVMFGLVHIITTRSISNSFFIFEIFFFLGLIYKYSGNSIGPMIAWIFINNYNWYLIQWLWI